MAVNVRELELIFIHKHDKVEKFGETDNGFSVEFVFAQRSCRLTEEVKPFDKQRLAFHQKRSVPFEEKGQSFYRKGAVLLGKRSSPFRERIMTVLSCRDLDNCQTAKNAKNARFSYTVKTLRPLRNTLRALRETDKINKRKWIQIY